MSETTATLEELRARVDSVRTGGVAEGFPAIHKVGRQKPFGANGRVAIVDGAARRSPRRAPSSRSSTSSTSRASPAPRWWRAPASIRPKSTWRSSAASCRRSTAPNLGREVVFRASLPASVPGSAVNLACASSNRAITSGAEAILQGEAEVVLAGGAESLSNVPMQFSRNAAAKFQALQKARTLGARLAARRRAPAARLRAGAAGDRRVHHRPDHGRVVREDGEGERHLAAARRTRSRCSRTSAPRRPRPRAASRPDRAGLPAAALRAAGGPRQRRARRLDPRGARRAAAGLRPPLRHAHRRQLLADHRRRLGGAADERGEGARRSAARRSATSAPGPASRSRPEAAPAGAGLRRAAGARARRAHARRHRPGRDARGVRGAGALEPQGVRLAEVRARGARAAARRWARSTSSA